jgi:hypothetical protein
MSEDKLTLEGLQEAARTAERNSWQYRAIAATRGNQTRLGALVIAVMGKAPKNPPAFARRGANIDPHGYVLCNFAARDGTVTHNALVGHWRELRDNFRGLADHLQLDDAEREDMFRCVRDWIYLDLRPNRGDLFQ